MSSRALGPRYYLAAPVLLLLGALLIIVFALCAAVTWLRSKFKTSQDDLSADHFEDRR